MAYSGSAKRELLAQRMAAAPDQSFALPIVSVEEQVRGWLAKIHAMRGVHRQVPGYERLLLTFVFLSKSELVAFDMRAADQFERLRKQKVRIGTQDLKIASIAIVQDALLLSANLRDFQKVPGLRVENWLA
jgi:tRNA(fMet)-specific endonuclease VapC